jgi:CDP-glucose 4,6-dehydratase
VVFHLAAQALVRQGYRDPVATLASNVMGTAHVLEAARATRSVRAVVVVTTDKVYENRESGDSYRETDPLGGHDPYSASKAAAEIVVASYRTSFFSDSNQANIATARAGNVIGGGDWAADRIVPDCVTAFADNQPVQLRYPRAVRPWQHVLDALRGYVSLAERLLSKEGRGFAKPWNFGPNSAGDATVGDVAESIARLWGGDARMEQAPSAHSPYEAGLLRLDSTRAATELGWEPRWSLPEALKQTVVWYQAWKRGSDMTGFSLDQIAAHEEADRS